MENETKQTTESTEKKQGWLKSHLAICIICVVVIAAVAVGIFFVVQNQGNSPEKVAEIYVEAMNEGSSDKLMGITDVKGAFAWENCNRDVEKFAEEYGKVSDEDANSYKEDMKKSLDSAMAMLKAFGGVNISLKNVEKPEEIGKNLFKVKFTMGMEAFGTQQEQSLALAVYNGKFIGEISE